MDLRKEQNENSRYLLEFHVPAHKNAWSSAFLFVCLDDTASSGKCETECDPFLVGLATKISLHYNSNKFTRSVSKGTRVIPVNFRVVCSYWRRAATNSDSGNVPRHQDSDMDVFSLRS